MQKLIFRIFTAILLVLIFIFIGREVRRAVLIDGGDLIPILMYHHVVEEGKAVNKITITTNRFEEDMEHLMRKGYTTISFKELIDHKEGNGTLPEKPIMITFDDGYDDNYKNAYPILKKNNMKAIIFIIGSRIGIKDYKKDTRYSYFSWEQAKEMYESGLIEVQPHSYDLHHYQGDAESGQGVLLGTKESKKDYYNRFLEDTNKVVELIKENVGCDSYVYAYPYGKYVDISEEILKDLHFKVTLTTRSQYADTSKDLYKLKRINIPSHKRLGELRIN